MAGHLDARVGHVSKWLGIVALIIVGIVLLSVLGSPNQEPEPTPVSQVSTYTGPTRTPKSISRPTNTRTPQPPTPSPTPEVTIHVVQKGEWLAKIARRYRVTVEYLVACNNIKNPSLIYPGQELIISPCPGAGWSPTNMPRYSPPTDTPRLAAIPTPRYSETAYVTRVIDGDTIEVKMGERSYRVRYIGIDTPEQGEPFHSEATRYNREMVGGKNVWLEKDVSETDKYDRLLRYVYFQEGDEWHTVNGSLVYWGLAFVATYPPDVKYQDQFLEWQREARENSRGIWGASPVPGLPRADEPPPESVSCACDYNRYNCADFGGSWYQAQSCYEHCIRLGYGDVHILDMDNDGIACEALR